MAHELTRRGLKVVMFEAGRRQTPASFSQNPGEAFGQEDRLYSLIDYYTSAAT
jgi:choline dehydrogenase-like flavoprotein